MNATVLTIVIITVIMFFVIGSMRRINQRCNDDSEYSLHDGQVWRQ